MGGAFALRLWSEFCLQIVCKFYFDLHQSWHVHVCPWRASLFWIYSPFLSSLSPPSLSLSWPLSLTLLPFSDLKSSHFLVVTTLSKQLISHTFKLLPNFQSQCALLLFHVVLCLCAPGEGEESVLCESDVFLLKNIVYNNQMSLEKLLQEKKQGLYIYNMGLDISVYFQYMYNNK